MSLHPHLQAASRFVIAFQGEPGTGTPVAFVNYRWGVCKGFSNLNMFILDGVDQ
jgi:hypothetical protein